MQASTMIEVFDPPLCCSTGVCGPEVDSALVRISADFKWLQDRGVQVRRFNLAQEPIAFMQHPLVKRVLEEKGDDGLPIVLMDGHVVSQGEYPSRRVLAELTGVDGHPEIDPRQHGVSQRRPLVVQTPAARGCCGGGEGCC